MIIRSQDKKTIVNLDNLDAICIGGIKDEVVYSHTENVGTIRLGIYSDGEKAIKVLDMMQDTYLGADNGYYVANVKFEMPQDSEV